MKYSSDEGHLVYTQSVITLQPKEFDTCSTNSANIVMLLET